MVSPMATSLLGCLMRLFQVARRFSMEVQPQLVLLQKTLLNIEGLGRQLYPELDLMKTAKPIMEGWMRKRMSPAFPLSRLRPQLPALADALPQLVSNLIHDWPGDSLREQARELRSLRAEINTNSRRARWGMVASALLLGAAIALSLDNLAPARVADLPLASWIFGVLAAWAGWRALR